MAKKTNRLLASLITLLLLCAVASAQEQPKAVLVDEFGELCSEDVRSRMDSFFAMISNTPNATGYMVGLAPHSLSGRYQKFVRLFRNHIAFRSFSREKVKFLRGSDREDLRIQFWLVPPSASFSDGVPAYVRSPILVPTLFDASAINSIEDGEVQFGEDLGSEPCDFGLELEHFAAELSQQLNVEAHLVATSDRRHSARFVRRVLRLTKQELAKTYGFDTARIMVVYAGRAKQSEMQLWIVPRGTTRPRDFRSRIVDQDR